jgi:ribosomal protein L11 methyltransferase
MVSHEALTVVVGNFEQVVRPIERGRCHKCSHDQTLEWCLQVIVVRPHPARRDDLIGELWEHGTVGIIEEESNLKAYFPQSDERTRIIALENGEIIATATEDPCASYQLNGEDSEPVPLGSRFIVLPSSAVPENAGLRIPLYLAPSMAFGSGRHESTQLMVEAMEEYVKPGSTVADVGCGSGILCEVARHLGASTVIGCDSHADAIVTAMKTCPQALAINGSADAIAPFVADVVLANISAKIIDLLAAELVRIAKPDGILLLSGFIDDRKPERFRPWKVFEMNDWLCWLCRPELVGAGTSEGDRAVQPFETQWW